MDKTEVHPVYHRLSELYGKDLNVTHPFESQELVLVPICKENNWFGKAMILAVLAYPQKADSEKRTFLVRCIISKLIKDNSQVNSVDRLNLSKNHAIKSLINIPNKRINQSISIICKNIDRRIKAAYALAFKTASGADIEQISMMAAISKLRENNETYFRLFTNKDGSNENDVFEKFIERTLNPSKPVIHLAIALATILNTMKGFTNHHIFSLLLSDNWLEDYIYKAELYRINLPLLLPSKKKHGSSRWQNIILHQSQTIQLLPFVDQLKNPFDINLSIEQMRKETNL